MLLLGSAGALGWSWKGEVSLRCGRCAICMLCLALVGGGGFSE